MGYGSLSLCELDMGEMDTCRRVDWVGFREVMVASSFASLTWEKWAPAGDWVGGLR